MKRNLLIGSCLLGASCMFMGACEERDEVQEEMQELQEAQKNTGNVANELQKELAQAKEDVVRLEKQLALARQGITDEVTEERRDLKEALKQQEKEVESEVREAQRASQSHSTTSEKARQQLQQTQPPAKVDAHVESGATVAPGQKKVESATETEAIEVEKTYVKGTEPEEKAKPEDKAPQQGPQPKPEKAKPNEPQ